MITGFLWRRVRDSNPRDLSVYSISSAAPSTTRTTLRVYFCPVFSPEICSKIRWRENRRDGKKYSILRFSVLRNIKENQGDEIPSFCRNFESGPLCPLRPLSMNAFHERTDDYNQSREKNQVWRWNFCKFCCIVLAYALIWRKFCAKRTPSPWTI